MHRRVTNQEEKERKGIVDNWRHGAHIDAVRKADTPGPDNGAIRTDFTAHETGARTTKPGFSVEQDWNDYINEAQKGQGESETAKFEPPKRADGEGPSATKGPRQKTSRDGQRHWSMTMDRATRKEFRQRMRKMLISEMKVRAYAFAGQLEGLVTDNDAARTRAQTLTVRKARWGLDTDPEMGTIACADVARAIAMETVHTQHAEFAHFGDGDWLKLEPGGRCRRTKAPKDRHIIGRLPCEGITGSNDARRWANSVHAKREIAWSEELEEMPAKGENLAQWIERKDQGGTFVPGSASGEWMGEENRTIGDHRNNGSRTSRSR